MSELIPLEVAGKRLVNAAVGEAVVAKSATTGLFGLSLGATICVGIVGIFAVAGIPYLIVKKIRKNNSSNSNSTSNENLDQNF